MKIFSGVITLCLIACTGFAQKVKTDLEKENLKGNIDSVVHRTLTKYKVDGQEKLKLGIKVVSKYNQYGNLVTVALYTDSATNRAPVRQTYFYDGRQRLIKSLGYYEDGLVQNESLYKYNADANTVEYRNYDAGHNLLNTVVSYYNNEGDIIESMSYTKDRKQVWRRRCKYDKGNAVTIEYLNAAGIATSTTTMAYDALDNMIVSIEKQPGGRSVSKVFHYFNFDKYFNWLSMDEPGDPNHITQRTITYYK